MIEVPPRIRQLTEQVSATRDLPITRDVALIGARIVLAWVFIVHGARTLFGWFGGPGVHKAAVFYGTVAHLHPATFFTVLGGTIEFFGGIAVGVGVFGRLAGASLVGDMVMAMITVTFANGLSSPSNAVPPPGGGYELNLALAGVAFVVAMLGTGRFGLDTVIRNAMARGGHTHATRPVGAAGAAGGVVRVAGAAGLGSGAAMGRPASSGSPRPPD